MIVSMLVGVFQALFFVKVPMHVCMFGALLLFELPRTSTTDPFNLNDICLCVHIYMKHSAG